MTTLPCLGMYASPWELFSPGHLQAKHIIEDRICVCLQGPEAEEIFAEKLQSQLVLLRAAMASDKMSSM